SSVHSYAYDYRTRRITRSEPGSNPVAMTFSGGLSVAEFEVTDPGTGTLNTQPTVEYQRGPDMGGGVGGLLYSLRSGTPKFNLSNGRGDVVAQSDSTGDLTWTASYEAYGKRPVETGSNADRQRANTKEEDPTGLLNEGFRYRELETGVWMSKDPAGFVDGPNLYAYVRQNPWSKFDPKGLAEDDITRKSGVGHHKAPFADTRDDQRLSKDVKRLLNGDSIRIDGKDLDIAKDALIECKDHNGVGAGEYSRRYRALKEAFLDKAEKLGLKPTGTGKDAVEFAKALIQEVDNAPDDYIRTFNNMWREGKHPSRFRGGQKVFWLPSAELLRLVC
ncbi:RHS repeat-associated protein, partial [Roseimicrobium gellanilyticum]